MLRVFLNNSFACIEIISFKFEKTRRVDFSKKMDDSEIISALEILQKINRNNEG